MPAKKNTPVAIQETTASEVAESEMPESIRALDGDNYLSISERYGLDARKLSELNGCTPVLTGTLIRLV